MPEMTAERRERLRKAAYQRQHNFTVLLENVHDPHNISAVMRSCEAVGIPEIYILYTDPQLQETWIELGRKSSAGARKWLDVHYYTQMDNCVEALRQKYRYLYATHLDADAVSLHDMDMTTSLALVFGNEHDGVSEALLSQMDGNFIIPQMGMVQSLNISVACAVSVFEGLRQRLEKGFYHNNNPSAPALQEATFQSYLSRHDNKVKNKKVKRLD
ncbi:MAG: RNA methyltransferase [Saprospiraceae bacterium]